VEQTAYAYPSAHLTVDPQFSTADPFLILEYFGRAHGGRGMVDYAVDDDVGQGDRDKSDEASSAEALHGRQLCSGGCWRQVCIR
jgi:hypothetical protein